MLDYRVSRVDLAFGFNVGGAVRLTITEDKDNLEMRLHPSGGIIVRLKSLDQLRFIPIGVVKEAYLYEESKQEARKASISSSK